MDLVDAVYKAVRSFPRSEMFLLSQQMRSAAISNPANIAEGNGRWTTPDYRHFVIQSRGSLLELETEILIASRQQFLDEVARDVLLALTQDVGRLVNGLIRYLDEDPLKPEI